MKTAPLAVLVLLAAAAHAEQPSAEAVLAAAKAATGGAAWDKVQGCREEGTHGGGAIRYTTRFSLQRYGMRIDTEQGGQRRSMGYNGHTSWRTEGDGKAMIAADPTMTAEAVLTAYLSNNGFFFPERFPANVRYLRRAREAGHTYDLLEISPIGGRPAELWFDTSTHLLRRVVDTHGTPPTKVEALEYREVGGFLIATRLIVYGPDGKAVDHGEVAAFTCGPIDAVNFDPPKEG